jgi:hypothetical protein
MADADRLARLEAEADIRRLAARYMTLCDAPEPDVPGRPFADLFTADLVWEGVGRTATEFGRVEGRDKLLAWFDSMREPPRYAFNAHFLTSEQIAVDGDGEGATGGWLMLQLALRSDGTGEVRMARLSLRFRREDAWRIAHFQTEALFRYDAAPERVAALLKEAAA